MIISKTPKEIAKAMGLSPSKAVEWQVRYDLTKKIIELVNLEDLTISEVAKGAGTSRARVTEVLKGQTEGISVDVLLRILGGLGSTVKISFKKAS